MPENKERSDEEISEKPDEIKKDNNDHPVSKADEKKSDDDKSDNKKAPAKKKRKKKKTKKNKSDTDTSDKEKSDKDNSEQQKSDNESDAEKTDEKESDDKKSDEDKSDKKKSDKKKKKKKHRLSKLALKAAEKAAVYTVVQTEKAAKDAVNSNYRNTSAISNTGAKSVELTKKTAKTTVKTAKTTVKTVKKTINTVKNAPKNIRKAVKNTKRAVKATVKVVKATVKAVKATVKVIAKLLAWLSNPVVFLIVLAIAVLAYIIFAYVTVLGGAVSGEAATKQAYSQAAGLGNVPAEFQQGQQVLNSCKDAMKKKYDDWIDDQNHLYYDDNNKRKSALVYMEKYDKLNNMTKYDMKLASGGMKGILKNALSWDSGIDDAEILSIAYVLDQKSKNEIRSNADYRINTVTYTEDLINKVLYKVVEWKDTNIKDNMDCPDHDCVIEEIKTQEKCSDWDYWENAANHLNNAANAYKEIINKLGEYEDPNTNPSALPSIWNYIEGLVASWKSNYGTDNNLNVNYYPKYGTKKEAEGFLNYPIEYNINYCKQHMTYVDKTEYKAKCEYEHKLYSEVLEFYDKDQIMSMLAFNDTDKYWQQLTEQYLRTLSAPTP